MSTRHPSSTAASMLVLSLALLVRAGAHEPPSGLLAHLTFDGTLADASGNGFGAEVVAGVPMTVQGKFGGAVKFDGSYSLRVPLDLHYDQYPQITIAGWVYLDTNDARGALVGTGSGDGPRIQVNADNIFGGHASGRNEAHDAIRPGRWQFFAGSWDYEAGTMRLNWGARSQTEQFDTADLAAPSSQDLWLGALNDLRVAATALAIDDVRIYDRVLSDDELEGLRLGPPDELISGTGEQGSSGATSDVEGDAESPGREGGFVVGGRVVDSDLLVGLNPDEATALRREIEALLESSSSQTLAAAPGEIDLDASAELAGDEGANLPGIPGTSDTTGATGEPVDIDPGDVDYEAAAELAGEETCLPGVPGFELCATEDEDGGGETSTGWHLSESDVVRTSVAGASGEIKRPIEADGVLETLLVREYSNVPCYVELNDSPDARVDECTTAFRGVFQELEASVAPRAVGRLAVCSSGTDNRRVKGIELGGEVIRADGSRGDYAQRSDALTNCAEWQPAALCSSGRAATGVVAHFNQRRPGSNELVGMQLICRRIVVD